MNKQSLVVDIHTVHHAIGEPGGKESDNCEQVVGQGTQEWKGEQGSTSYDLISTVFHSLL